MNDLTILYYTANRISAAFAEAVMVELRRACGALPIIAVSQGRGSVPHLMAVLKPREHMTVDGEPSIYQVYRNILLAAQCAQTPYVACCEDDTVYTPSHFTYRPPLDIFAYDRSRWVITRDLSRDGKSRVAKFYWRERHQMAMCIAPRELLIETLEEKFAKYPVPPASTDVAKKAGWGEPGRYEKNLGLTRRAMTFFDAFEPSVTFNHSMSLMGRRRVNVDDVIVTDLPPWGNATALWERIHG